MTEIRLVYGCGCVDRWEVAQRPAHVPVEIRNPEPCKPCRDRDDPVGPSVEELAQAQYEREHPERKRRHRT